jgi:hypothetical protein
LKIAGRKAKSALIYILPRVKSANFAALGTLLYLLVGEAIRNQASGGECGGLASKTIFN